MSNEVDVVVVGLGPGGESVATDLAQAGLEVVGIDRHLVGGECPYYGCIPTKMMVRAADVLAEARRVPELAGSSTVSPDWTSVAKRIRDEATDSWNDQVAVDRLVEAGVRFVRGQARLDGPRSVVVGDESYVPRHAVVLNTGTDPGVPPVDGLADTPYWTNRDVVKLENLPSSLIVIGGGAIGAEIAQALSRFDVAVTLLEVADRILAAEEPEASRLMTETFGSEGIQVLVGVSITKVSYAEGRFSVTMSGPDSVEQEGGEAGSASTLYGEKLLVAAGRRNQLADIGLETVGLDPESKILETDEHMQVADGLFAIGDITGKGAFTHMSMYQAGIARDAILSKADRGDTAKTEPAKADYRAVPRVTFTDPEVGSVGLTEQKAKDEGLRVRVGFADLATSSRGWLHKSGNAGFVKVVEDADAGVLVGATTAGPDGGELLAGLTMAVHARVPTSSLLSMIYAFPTFHQAIKAAVEDLHDSQPGDSA